MKHASRILWTLFAMFFLAAVLVTILGEKGLRDLQRRKAEHATLIAENSLLLQENSELYHEVDRLNHDPSYIEAIARRELGLIRENEFIIRSQ